ncbi:MAG: Asp-tRNA(Asn)/Glu-tRNA(Gln) amidotransferase subunit GatB [Ruminococcaceae bacterium]|nr:Asp-tRNA(Asn)/Glu-tRNA(Gln) amidotransferase subunit GatB [Oscillospiraceae bacterium]
MTLYKGYEAVIGLEIHVELKTKTKMFCACKNGFGAMPNTLCCPVCMGMPGALPTMNAQAVEYAVMAGIAANCKVNTVSAMARKNYFYPDLPKGYQITQGAYPICEKGALTVDGARIGITRIHMEEDAGKLIHSKNETLIDFNRCGVPLIEIVTEPDLRSSEQAKAFLKKLRTVLLYTGISDCKMNEGALRCDVNLSVRKPGQAPGVRTEIKNINSFSFVAKAIEYEYHRQADLLEADGTVVQETRRFDESTGKTYSMRSKENAADYRYFPEPDLPPVYVSEEQIENVRMSLPAMPDERIRLYQERYGIAPTDGERLSVLRENADLFEAAAKLTRYPQILAKQMLTFSADTEIALLPMQLSVIADMTGDGRINSSTAKTLLSFCQNTDIHPEDYATEHDLFQICDKDILWHMLCAAAQADPKSANDFKNGKTAAGKAIVGKVMAESHGRADAKILQVLLQELKK